MDKTLSGRNNSARTPSFVRVLGFAFDRLAFRLAIGIALFVIVPLGGALYVLSHRQFDRGIEARRRAAESENRILEVALRHRMLERDATLMEDILREVAAHPDVRNVMIVNHDGEVRISSRKSDVGDRIGRDSPTCLVCHAQDPRKRQRWVLLPTEQGDILRTVQPIENRTECHKCHDPQRRYNGMLLLDISLAQLRSELRRDLAGFAAGTAALAFLLLGGVGFLVRFLILKRLARVGRAARSISAGNLSVRVPTVGNDVIGELAAEFNDMAGSVSHLISEVQQQEAQLTSVMNSLDDGLIVLNRDGRVLACNRSFSRRVNLPPEALQASRCHDTAGLKLPCCEQPQLCPVSRCVATGDVQRAIIHVPSPSGETERVDEVYASPVFDENGNVAQVVEVWRDITERVKEAERLAEIERLVSLGTLASGFSHEVNTPLASMLTCAESVIGRIEETGPGTDQDELLASIRQAAEIIRRQVLRCRKTTEQFLRFSRGIPPSIEPIDLAQRVAEVVSLARHTASADNVELRYEPRKGIPSVRANAEVVQHVVLNLLVNAIQSCPPDGGSVEVSVEVDEDVRVRVRDSGCGIRAEDRKHLFEPFRSRKPQGTGLGLFLSRTFMRRFGGDVRLVESVAGMGSCFEIIFQRSTEGP